jgi:hypothetical protein
MSRLPRAAFYFFLSFLSNLRKRAVVCSRSIRLAAISSTNVSQSSVGNFLAGRSSFVSRKTRHDARAVRLLPSTNA